MKIFGLRRLQSNGQVSIPAEVVRMLDLKGGDLVLFVEDDCGIVIKKAEVVEAST